MGGANKRPNQVSCRAVLGMRLHSLIFAVAGSIIVRLILRAIEGGR